MGRGREEEAAYCKYHVSAWVRAVAELGFRKLLRLLSDNKETILDVLWGGVLILGNLLWQCVVGGGERRAVL